MLMSLILVVMLILLCGCTGTKESGSANTSGNQTVGSEKTVLNIGYQPSTHQLAFMTAYSKGMYNDTLSPYGIKEIKAFNFPTGAPEMNAMMTGDLDFAYVGAAPFVTAAATGLDGKMFGSVQTQGSSLVLKPNQTYSSPSDLKGLTIATFPAGTIQDTVLKTWLKRNGVDPNTDLKIVAMGPGDATTAMIAGKVDGAFLPSPSDTTIEKAGAGKIVVKSGEMAPDHACCVLVASGNMIKNHPDIVTEVLKIHEQATNYTLQNTDEAAGYMETMTGMKKDDILLSLDEWDGHWVSDPNIIEKSVDEYSVGQRELGYITKNLTKQDLIDTSFWDKINK
jgi:NitT/TauT family transport system substrate-binding protein